MLEKIITKENFTEEVINSTKPVLVDFWATWCGPCMMLSPIVSEIAEKYGDKISVCKINVDEQPELAERYNIFSIPTLMVFKNGEITNQSVGVVSTENIEKMLF